MFCKRKGKKKALFTSGWLESQKGNGINFNQELWDYFVYAVVFLATLLINEMQPLILFSGVPPFLQNIG
jgi:hypothetical protein